MTTPRPAQRPPEPPADGWRLPSPWAVTRALLRHLAGSAATSTAAVAQHTAHLAAALGHPRHLGVVPTGIAQGRADLQFTHGAARDDLTRRAGTVRDRSKQQWNDLMADQYRRDLGHGASEGDPDL
jgi:hypothetical protein